MSLTAQFSDDFNDGVVRRGAEYFRSRRVTIGSVSASRLMAVVRGSMPYLVKLERGDRRLLASCTCPYFEDDLCKHIWAVLQTADAQRVFQQDEHNQTKLVRGKPARGDEGELDDSAVEGDDDEAYDGDIEATHDGEYGRHENIESPRPPLFRFPQPSQRAQSPPSAGSRKPTTPDWRKQLSQLPPAKRPSRSSGRDAWPPKRELLYVINAGVPRPGGGLYLEVLFHDLKKDGTWSKAKSRHLPRTVLYELPDLNDRRILASLAGATEVYGPGGYGYGGSSYYDETDYEFAGTIPFRYRLSGPQPELLLPIVCETGRCRLRIREEDKEDHWLPVTWDDAEPWQFRLQLRRAQTRKHYELTGALWRGTERMELIVPAVLTDAGVLLAQGRAARYQHHGAFNWIVLLRKQGPIRVPETQGEEFLQELLHQQQLPPLDLPEELRYEEAVQAPRPHFTLKPHKWDHELLQGELSFDYAGKLAAHDDSNRGFLQTTPRRLLFVRNFEAEKAAARRLYELGGRSSSDYQLEAKFELAARRLPQLVKELTAEGWHVEAQGKIYRSPGKFELQVSSGLDWFELHGEVDFGGTAAKLPELLAALRRGENMVKLDDGSLGLLPQEWLKQYGMLAGLGDAHGEHLRFTRSQVGLLDALLAAQPEARCDALFVQVRNELRHFAGIQPLEAPAGFIGELRPYQKDGLGWFEFLRRFGFGGCLADDMGLGKTVQVLALLEARRQLHAKDNGNAKPAPSDAKEREAALSTRVAASLVVVPRSLIFNWKTEAARFAPRLRVLDHTGTSRLKGYGHFEDYDLVLTTYGTLRNDAADFKDVKFDYVILDEAQAIKNPSSVSAKAARLLQADHRLALSGTPIENHLGELWSLFEFLNPRMLGAASVFNMVNGAARNPDEPTRKLLSHALRPFILRRTKEQVARDLPTKVEQTLYCDLDERQRRLYDQLRDHYRHTLLERVKTGGIARAKIQILEALLRLRQAAIHPGLLDKGRLDESSAKLEVLLPRVLQVIEEGHKTLVFSQFTGMLAILRRHLDDEGIGYEYLDGKTRDRQACVDRFQTNPHCKLFLISLKAGGLGLNLTAAQYVFLLDPWWNPAVESQAIDRAHRIGQTSQVFAYRLIARGTVEEKVLELQNTKRDLADAIVGANEGVMRNLGREDLELLLS